MIKRLALLLVLCLSLAGIAQAQVVFDANATAPTQGSAIAGATGVTLTTLTVGVGTNRGLIVQLGFSLTTISGVTIVWDSGGTNQTVTAITGAACNGSGGNVRAMLAGLVAPTSGAKTLKVTWTGTSDVELNALSWTGVDQTGGVTSFPHGTCVNGASSVPSVTITSAVNNATVETNTNDFILETTPSKTQTYADATPATIAGAGSRAAGAASNVHSWGDSATNWAAAGTDILAASAGAACPKTRLTLGVGC